MYRAIYATIGGTTNVGLWRPRLIETEAPTALLLGRSPENWYGSDPSDTARQLVDAGYWVVTVDTPNWGNATDMASIDTALSWLETNWGRSTDRLVVVAHNAGCVAALNWGMRHHYRVASMNLLSPIIDLVERFKRVTADQASITTAFGNPIGMVLPGNSDSYASMTAHASLAIPGDLDVRVEAAATDWTPSSTQALISKVSHNAFLSDFRWSYRLRLTTAGMLQFSWSPDGTDTAVQTATSTVAPSVSNGATLAVRATIDVNNEAGGRTITFYTAPSIDGTWTQLGSPVVQAGTTSIFVSASNHASVTVGAANGAELFAGLVLASEVRSGINGTVVSRMDFRDHTDTTGRGWTLNGSARQWVRTWNPAHRHRKYIIADYLGDRLKIWWAASDTQTPPAVTAALAAEFGAATGTLTDQNPVLVDPAPVVTDTVAADAAWFNQPAHEEMDKWHSYVETSDDFTDYKGGDACATTILPDGRWVTTFADSFLSNLTPAAPAGSDVNDGTFTTGLPTRNMIVVHDSSGAITGQVFDETVLGAIVPNQTTYPSHWYWPIDKIVDNGSLQVACWIVNHNSGTFGHIADSHIVTLDPTTLEVTAAVPLNVGEIFSTYGLFSDGGFIYILGQEYVGGYDTYDIDTITQTRIARVPVGQLTTPSAWEFRTSSGWSPSSAAAVPIVDNTAANLQGDSCITKVGSTFVLAAFGPSEGAVRLYSSSNPWGPWTQYDTIAIPQLGATRYQKTAVGYHPKWHRHLDADGRIMLSWNGNFFGTDGNGLPFDDTDYFHMAPHFLLVSPP